MVSLVTLTYSQPTRDLAAGEVLVAQGDRGGDLYVLERGRLAIERDGVRIAEVTEPGSLVGEMSVLTGSPNSATVRADGKASVRVVRDAIRFLERQPEVAVHVASVLARRLDATSAVLVERSATAPPAERSFFDRMLSTLFTPPSVREG